MIYKNLTNFQQDLPKKGRMIGLDVGTKTIGVSICDDHWYISSPKTTIIRKSNAEDFVKIKQIIDESKIVGIVVGLPLNMDDSESKMSEFVRKFTGNLNNFLADQKIIFFDERLSSYEAEELMRKAGTRKGRKKAVIDQIAASVILQGLIDCLNNNG
ncbi:MAG: putative Holliday junction resolvase [Lentimonas sp.]|jgi:putative Holliday junction resolvase